MKKYIIYCRKSTDESSDNQKQSIPDQIKACIEYAERENLKIKEKPKNFSLFETDDEIQKEQNEPDLTNKQIYQDTKHLFIIKEQETGKIPGKRKKWNSLIKKIKKGEVYGLLSYSPDRQARNMLEGGELINCVDEELVDLKYTNFHFENNAAGKMMLGIWFVFSKQYSDKLSEDILRGNKSKVISGKSIGTYKHGYIVNSQGFYQPHQKFFKLIQEAFKMKLESETENNIKDFLDDNGYFREYKNGDRKKINSNSLNIMFRDEFYYGIHIHGGSTTDLRETNPYYQPIVTEEQFQILQDRYLNNANSKINKKKTINDYNNIRVFDNDFILTYDGFGLNFTIPNKKRHLDKIKKANRKGEKLYLEDIIKPNQIHYYCANKNSKYKGLKFSQRDIDEQIIKVLKTLKVKKGDFDIYTDFMSGRLEEIGKQQKNQEKSIEARITRLKKAKRQYIDKLMMKDKDDDELKIYQEKKDDFDKKIRNARKELESLDKSERNQILELEIFLDILNNADKYYIKSNYVQKRKITKILFLNIKITQRNRLKIQVKPEFKPVFSRNWWWKSNF